MSIILDTWATEWELYEKVEFDGPNKLIIVHEDVTELDIRIHIWSAWLRWLERRNNSKYTFAMRSTGYDNTPAGKSGDIYFLINGWKLVLDVKKLKVTGVLYSDDFETAYYDSATMQPIYPVIVSALVNTAVTNQNVITGTAITADEVWAHIKALTVPKFLGLK